MALSGCLLALAACAGSPTAGGPTPTASPRAAHTGAVAGLLLRLDEMPLPGFTVTTPATALDAAGAAGGDAALEAVLGGGGFREGATARYFRSVPVLRTSVGPIDVTTTVLRFGDGAEAAAAMAAFGRHLDAIGGAIPSSTGPLADGGHAIVQLVTDQGVTVAQTTLVWRAGDLLTVLVLRERDTGSPLQDALLVARPEVIREAA